ncbi:MAG: hypothetical protein WKG07_35030 [Hymenobacter sp.]
MSGFWKYLRQKIINTTFYRTKGAVSHGRARLLRPTPRVWARPRVPANPKISYSRRATHFVTSITT